MNLACEAANLAKAPMQTLPHPTPGQDGPDRLTALAQYGQRAATYDAELMAFEPIRLLAIDELALCPGQTVIDVGCGTGLSLARLGAAVGAGGRIIAVEQCPEMMAQASRRIGAGAQCNVELQCAPAEDMWIDAPADAALLHFTHDILRSPSALARVLSCLKPGARVVASGLCWAPPWAVAVNLFVWGAALRSVSSLQGLDQPWSLLSERVDGLAVRELMLGSVFVAAATRR